MSYKYLTSGSPTFFKTSQEVWQGDFQALIDDAFSNASTYRTISKEFPFSTGSLISTNVRVTSAIDNITGMKLGDDFKNLYFSGSSGSAVLGEKYYFNNNYYLVVNTNNVKRSYSSVTIRRCNNSLRWVDENGNSFSEHCIIDYKIATPNNINRTDPLFSDGTIQVICQGNSHTRKIKENQRFLFGNTDAWNCYRVFGGGIQNFLNDSTTDNNSSKLFQFALGKQFVNSDTDDLVNGIADYNKNVLLLSISPSAITGGSSDTYQLYDTVTLNDIVVSRAIAYSTSSSSVASISGSIVTLNATGSCVITGVLVDNPTISDSVIITVSGSLVENNIRVSPLPSYILQGDTQAYTVYAYNNGVQESDAFTFTLANANVPVANYTFTTIDDNSFSVENIKLYLDYPLIINAVSGSLSKQISILLKGSY